MTNTDHRITSLSAGSAGWSTFLSGLSVTDNNQCKNHTQSDSPPTLLSMAATNGEFWAVNLQIWFFFLNKESCCHQVVKIIYDSLDNMKSSIYISSTCGVYLVFYMCHRCVFLTKWHKCHFIYKCHTDALQSKMPLMQVVVCIDKVLVKDWWPHKLLHTTAESNWLTAPNQWSNQRHNYLYNNFINNLKL